MPKTIRWGIAGTGAIASLFAEGLVHARDTQGRGTVAELVAVGSRSASRSQAFAARHGVREHSTYEGLAANKDVDIVYVATPNSDHAARCLQMIDAGKAVICEKPFALDAAETRTVIAAAGRKNVFCMEAMWMRFMPAVDELLEQIGAGALGDPTSATIELGHPVAFRADHRLFDAALGGGALLDLGVYAVSLAALVFGAPTSIQSQALIGASGVDEHVTALLGYTGGRQSMVGASLRTRLANGASVAGTKGWAKLHEPLYRPTALTLIDTPVPLVAASGGSLKARAKQNAWLRGAVHRLRAAVPPAFLGGGRTLRRPYAGNGYAHEAIEAMRCLGAGQIESPKLPLSHTLSVMETLDAIRENWKVL